MLKMMNQDCPLLKQMDLINQTGHSKSQVYQWLQGVDERKERSKKQIDEAVIVNAVETIMTYPHMSGPKGQAYLIYHRLGYISHHFYMVLKKIVRILVFQQVSQRQLLPEKTSYVHERPQAVGDIWAEDFTQVKVCGVTMYISLIIDVFSGKYLGLGVSQSATSDLVNETVTDALRQTDGVGPKEFLISDNGRQYISDAHTNRLDVLDIVHKRIPSCRPSYNGSVECGIKEWKNVFYPVFARSEIKAPSKEKTLQERVFRAAQETTVLLNTDIPRPCLSGVTPDDVYYGRDEKRRQENLVYVEQQKSNESTPWSGSLWQMVRSAMNTPELSNHELMTTFCFFLKRPLRKLPNLVFESG